LELSAEKKFLKIVFPKNSEENSAEFYFPQEKMYKKSAPGLDKLNRLFPAYLRGRSWRERVTTC
jgi:hypothetical protein